MFSYVQSGGSTLPIIHPSTSLPTLEKLLKESKQVYLASGVTEEQIEECSRLVRHAGLLGRPATKEVEEKLNKGRFNNMQISRPLIDAAKGGDVSKALLLLRAGADPDILHPSDGRTPLHVAVLYNKVSVALRLMAREANPNVQDNKGQTPTLLAASQNNWPMVKHLLLAGEGRVNVDLRDKQGRTVRQMTAASQPELLSLIDHRAPGDFRLPNSRPPLLTWSLWATQSRNFSTVAHSALRSLSRMVK